MVSLLQISDPERAQRMKDEYEEFKRTNEKGKKSKE